MSTTCLGGRRGRGAYRGSELGDLEGLLHVLGDRLLHGRERCGRASQLGDGRASGLSCGDSRGGGRRRRYRRRCDSAVGRGGGGAVGGGRCRCKAGGALDVRCGDAAVRATAPDDLEVDPVLLRELLGVWRRDHAAVGARRWSRGSRGWGGRRGCRRGSGRGRRVHWRLLLRRLWGRSFLDVALGHQYTTGSDGMPCVVHCRYMREFKRNRHLRHSLSYRDTMSSHAYALLQCTVSDNNCVCGLQRGSRWARFQHIHGTPLGVQLVLFEQTAGRMHTICYWCFNNTLWCCLGAWPRQHTDCFDWCAADFVVSSSIRLQPQSTREIHRQCVVATAPYRLRHGDACINVSSARPGSHLLNASN